eukprot:scaffold177547_cov17-Prasinocladus_malaysianus.AAC.1
MFTYEQAARLRFVEVVVMMGIIVLLVEDFAQMLSLSFCSFAATMISSIGWLQLFLVVASTVRLLNIEPNLEAYSTRNAESLKLMRRILEFIVTGASIRIPTWSSVVGGGSSRSIGKKYAGTVTVSIVIFRRTAASRFPKSEYSYE